MALHIQMSEEAELTLKRRLMRSKISAIAACLGFVSIGGAALYFTYTLIKGNEEPAFKSYEPPPSNKPPTKEPKVQELSSKSSPPSAALAPPVIVSTASSSVVMAATDFPSPDFGFGNEMGIGDGLGGNGIGDGLGDSGGGMGSGDAGGSTLEGTLYDLKLTKSGASTGINPSAQRAQVANIFKDFFENGWNDRELSKYYRSPTKLYASNFFVPVCHPKYAPIAFQCADKVQPSGWAVIYRGRVKAPKSGSFRFVGAGDDVIAVRFNRKMVLETGYNVPTDGIGPGARPQYRKDVLAGKYPKKKGYEFIKIPGANTWNQEGELGGMTAGLPFTVKEGQVYDIEIFLSEIPGGLFGFALLIDDIDDGLVVDGKKVFDIFRTNFGEPNKEELTSELQKHGALTKGMEWPQFNADAPIWTSVP